MLHTYPTAAERRSLMSYGPTSTQEFEDLDAAIAAARALLEAAGDAFVAGVHADPDLCSLEDYLRASYVTADYLDAHPQDGSFVTRLMDADAWRAEGITTARALDDQLFWSTFSDAYKEANGFRPRFQPESRAEAERMLDGLFARIAEDIERDRDDAFARDLDGEPSDEPEMTASGIRNVPLDPKTEAWLDLADAIDCGSRIRSSRRSRIVRLAGFAARV
jgi:hypothetical protein